MVYDVHMTVLSWRGDPQVKADAVATMKEHRAADRFAQGFYAQLASVVRCEAPETTTWLGCFHGCLTTEALAAEHHLTPEEYIAGQVPFGVITPPDYWLEGERLWGIPEELGCMLDHVFETHVGLQEAGDWAVAVTEAIPVGVDLRPLTQRLRKEKYLSNTPLDPQDVIDQLVQAGP